MGCGESKHAAITQSTISRSKSNANAAVPVQETGIAKDQNENPAAVKVEGGGLGEGKIENLEGVEYGGVKENAESGLMSKLDETTVTGKVISAEKEEVEEKLPIAPNSS